MPQCSRSDVELFRLFFEEFGRDLATSSQSGYGGYKTEAKGNS
jgi:hypothetical protein